MSYLLVLAAAQAAQERRKRARQRARQELSKRNAGQKKSDYSESYHHSRISYEECVNLELSEDNELKEFFNLLMRNVQKVRADKKSDIAREGTNILPWIDKYEEAREQALEILEKSGVTLGTKEYHLTVPVNGFDLPESDFKEQYKNYPTCFEFNGIRLNKTILDDPDYFKTRYEKAHNVAEGSRALISSYERELKDLELMQKFNPFYREKRSRKINEINEQIKQLSEDLRKEEEAKRELDVFEGFTDEQKKELKFYFEATDIMRKASDSVKGLVSKFLKELPRVDDKDILDEAFAKTIEDEDLTEDDILNIFKRLDKVAIKRYRGEYDGRYYIKQHDYARRGTRDDMIEGFIKHIYEEDSEFVDRNMDQVLEDEQTRE